jgi:hypothetical protein
LTILHDSGSTRALFPPSLKWFGKGQQQQKTPGSREEMSEEDSEYGGILSSFGRYEDESVWTSDNNRTAGC